MGNEVVSMNVPEKVVAEIVKAEVSAKVAAALKGETAIIENIVQAALTMRVDSKGEPSRYSDAVPYIEHLMIDAIKQSAKDAMKQYIEENSSKIKAEVEKQLKKSTSALVSAFMGNVLERAREEWRFGITVDVKKPERF